MSVRKMQLETNEEGNGTPGPLLTGGTGGLGLLAARTMPVAEPPAQLTTPTCSDNLLRNPYMLRHPNLAAAPPP